MKYFVLDSFFHAEPVALLAPILGGINNNTVRSNDTSGFGHMMTASTMAANQFSNQQKIQIIQNGITGYLYLGMGPHATASTLVMTTSALMLPGWEQAIHDVIEAKALTSDDVQDVCNTIGWNFKIARSFTRIVQGGKTTGYRTRYVIEEVSDLKINGGGSNYSILNVSTNVRGVPRERLAMGPGTNALSWADFCGSEISYLDRPETAGDHATFLAGVSSSLAAIAAARV